MAVKHNIRSITLIFFIVFILGVSVNAYQEYIAINSNSPDGSVYEWIDTTDNGISILEPVDDNSVEVFVPEFPTLAIPAGLLVGMVYILFLLKNKGKNHRSAEKEN